MAEAVAEEYRSSLADLNFNSKPHINMLTMLAEDNVQYAPLIVDTIVNHIKSVPPDLKLPSLYLVDSIMKNIGGKYIAQFSKHMIELFGSVFEKVDEATRSSLYKLRQTWNDILPKTVLYGIDCRVNSIDPAWPITAKVTAKSIHVNPKFVSGSANNAQNLIKESEIKKKQDEMKKLIEEKAEREKMLKLIEEKRAQLRLLEAKKLHLQHAKFVESVLKQKNQSNSVIHRDPRLKKAVALIATSEAGNIPDTPVPVSVQSVVVIPNVNSKTQGANSKSSHQEQDKKDKNVINQSDTRSSDSPNDPRSKSNRLTPEESVESNSASSKKRALINPKESSDNKKLCKDSINVNNSNMSALQNDQSVPVHNTSDPTNKSINSNETTANLVSSNDTPKMTTTTFENKKEIKLDTDERRAPSIPLFLGSEDKDYRKLPRPIDQPQLRNDIVNPTDIQSVPIHQNVVNLPPKEISNDIREKLHVSSEQMSMPLKVSEFTPLPLQTSVPISQTISNFKDVMKPDLIPTTAARGSPIPFTQSFKLDGKDRIIHFVDKRAFAFMDDNKPHEISFIGTPKNVFVEGLPQPLTLGFDRQSQEFTLDGKRNIIQFGTPSREIYINNHPYEIQFGGPPLVAPLGSSKLHHIRIEGPPPQVLIGEKPSYELYESFNKMHKSSLHLPALEPPMMSSEKTLPFQDVDMRLKSKPLQPPRFFESTAAKLKDIDWRQAPTSEWNVSQSSIAVSTNSLTNSTAIISEKCPPPPPFPQIADEMQGNIINDRVLQTAPWSGRPPLEKPSLEPSSFGPLPPPPRLPMALNPLPPPPPLPNLPSVDLRPIGLSNLHSLDVRPTGLSNLPSVEVRPTGLKNLPSVDVRPTSWKPLPPPPMFPTSVPSVTRSKVPLLPTPHILPIVTAPSTVSLPLEKSMESTAPVVAPPIDVGSFFEKLVAAGIISKKEPSSAASNEKKDSSKDKPDGVIKDVKETKIPVIELVPKSLKQFYPGVLTFLYKGSQCATCGMRFKNSQGKQYGRHLDWHFRMNRREKDGAKKALSRKLFYNLQDWIQFNEIEEVEERAPSYFELQAGGISVKKEEAEKIHSVRASECETEKCCVCGEQFQLFWVEEEEEWHLRNAVRHDSEVFHPACYEDFIKASKSPPAAEISKEETDEEAVKKETVEVSETNEEVSEANEEVSETNEEVSETNEEVSKEKTDVIKETSVEEKMDVEETPFVKVPIKEEPLEPPSSDNAESSVTPISDKPIDNSLEIKIKEEPIDGSETTKEIKEPMDGSETTKEIKEPMDGSETTKEIIEEPMDSSETTNSPSKIIVYMNDDFLNDLDEEAMQIDESSESNTKTGEQKTIKNKELKCQESQPTTENTLRVTGDVESEEDEFRPPTPDPRFDIQPPIFKGTELSALCTIM